MNRMFTVKALFSATVSCVVLGVATSTAQAQSLYEPYYYQNREQFQTMTSTHLVNQHTATPDVSGQLNYVPDTRLDPNTNKRLAQGEYPPVPTYIHPMVQPAPSTISVSTIPGIDFGIQGSTYKYAEPPVVSIVGQKIGITPSITQTFGTNNQYFGTVDFRYAFGTVDYKGSGEKNNIGDDLWEIRGVVGRDFTWDDQYALSPYGGFGYRHLYNDAHGLTTSGNWLYRRESQYMYAPIGLTSRARINGDSRIALNTEYDYFIHGQQNSYLSDGNQYGGTLPDLANQQNSGYGIKASLMYENGDWELGPFLDYWNIHASAISTVYNLYEPPNNTLEYGFQIKYRFVEF